MSNSIASGLWDATTTWNGGVLPGLTASITIATGTVVETNVAAVAAPDAGGALQQTAGKITIQTGATLTLLDGGTSANVADLTVNAGGTLNIGNPAPGSIAGNLTVNGTMRLYGTLQVQWGSAGGGSITIANNLWLYNGAILVNYCPSAVESGTFTFSSGWNPDTTVPVMTYTVIQNYELPPTPITLLSQAPWTQVEIDGMLGGIGVKTIDYGGNVLDPLYPPTAFVYRNGSLWKGSILISRSGIGLYSVDLSLADGVWQLGDHGSIDIYWAQYESDEATVQWFCQTYYWLVDKLGYQTFEIVDEALPAAAPGTAGGLPLLNSAGLSDAAALLKLPAPSQTACAGFSGSNPAVWTISAGAIAAMPIGSLIYITGSDGGGVGQYCVVTANDGTAITVSTGAVGGTNGVTFNVWSPAVLFAGTGLLAVSLQIAAVQNAVPGLATAAELSAAVAEISIPEEISITTENTIIRSNS